MAGIGLNIGSISNSGDIAVGIERKENAFQVESNSKDSIDITFQDPKNKTHKSSKIYKSSNPKGYTDVDGFLLSRENPEYDKLELFYPLSEDTKDKSGNTKDGLGYFIKPGMPGYIGCSTYFPGPFNSISFDGTDDYILINEKFQTPNFTVSFWAYAVDDGDTSNAHSAIANFYYDSGYAYGWGFYTPEIVGGYWRVFIGIGTSASWNGISTSSAVSYNEWHHVVGTYDGAILKFYIDNVLIGSITSTYGYSSAGNFTNGTEIGRNENGNCNYKGNISDVRIYNTAITADQVSDIYNYGTILGHEVAHYKMEKTMGTNLIDSSGNGYTGTLTNGPTYSDGPYNSSLVTENGAYVFGEKDSTVSVWLYTTYSDDKQVIFSNNGNELLFEFGIDKMSHETTYKKLFLKTKNSIDNKTGYFLITENDFEPNRWYFLTIVRKDNNGYIYVDGIRCSTFNRSLTNMPKPVAHYKLDETSGSTANDSSGNGYNGTINGATVNQIGYDGSVGAYSFDGTDDYINFATFPSAIPSGNSPFTISVWINPDVHDSTNAIVGWGNLSNNQANVIRLNGPPTTGLKHYFYNNDINIITDSFVGKWTHIAVTFDGTTRTIYVNGVIPSGGSDTPSNVNVAADQFRIGCRPNDNGERFDGKIDDVRIYNTAITADQVNELYQERSSIYNFEEKTNLKLHLPLNHSLKDISGNGYNGSFFGGNPSYVENYKGDQNGALSFDGVDDYIINTDFIDNVSTFFGKTKYTISLWIYSNEAVSSSIYRTAISMGYETGHFQWSHGHDANMPQAWAYNNGSWRTAKYTTTLIANTWYHIVGVYDSNVGFKAYLNGVLEATNSSSGTLSNPSSSVDLNIGAAIGGATPNGSNAASRHFDGQISDVRIYDRALTNIEVERLYQSTLRVNEYSPGTKINTGNLGSTNTPISIGKSISDKFHYRGYLQELKIFSCALTSVKIAELYHNYASNKYHEPLENDNMLLRNEDLLPNSKYLLAHYKFDGNGNDETGKYNLTSDYSPDYKKYGVFDQSSKLNSKIVAVGWGENQYGNLGIESTTASFDGIGNESGEMGDNLKYVNLGSGKYPVQIASGFLHTCAILNDGTVKCWGNNASGQLGYGDTNDRGDESNEMGDNLSTVDLGTGRTAVQISCGANHTCVILDDGTIKCWGSNYRGQLGYGNSGTTTNRGDDSNEMGDNLPTVNLGTGRTAVQISCGEYHTCVILDDGTVKCWGYNNYGQLGYETSSSKKTSPDATPVDLGTGRTAVQISCGNYMNCVLLDDGTIKCWGVNGDGQLGYGDTNNRGDDSNEMGDNLLPVDLGTGRTVVQISSGGSHTCVILDDGTVKCWGYNFSGQLGYGNSGTGTNRGDDSGEMGDNLPVVNLGTGRTAVQISAGIGHTCVLLDDGTIKCWGINTYGQLGIENSTQVNSPNTTTNVGSNLIKCIQLVAGRHHTFIIGQYKGVGATDLTIANQQYYTLPSTLNNIQSFSGWIKMDNIPSGTLPIVNFGTSSLTINPTTNSINFGCYDTTTTSDMVSLFVNGNLVSISQGAENMFFNNDTNSITASFNKNNKKITIDSQLQPIAHYKFDEGAGTTALDSSGNGYNGTLTNGPIYTSNQNGIYGKALSFDGSDDKLDLSAHPNLFTFAGGFTFSTWILFKTINTTSGQNPNGYFPRLFEFNNSSGNYIILMGGHAGSNPSDLIFDIKSSGSNYYSVTTTSNPLVLNTWMHITLTVNNFSRNVIIYKNGISILDTTIAGSYFEEARDISFIGNNNANSRGLHGDMSDVRIYNTALTATQVKQIYNNTLLSTNVTLNKDQLLYISDSINTNNNGYKNIVYSQNNKASNYETEIITNEYIDTETNDKINMQLGRIEPEKWYHIVLNTTFNNSTKPFSLKITSPQTAVNTGTPSANQISFSSGTLEQHDASFIDVLESSPGSGLKSFNNLVFILTRVPVPGSGDSGIAGSLISGNPFAVTDDVPPNLIVGAVFRGIISTNVTSGDITFLSNLTNIDSHPVQSNNNADELTLIDAAGSGGTSAQFVVYLENTELSLSKKTSPQTAVNTGTPSINEISFGATSNILEQNDNYFIDVLESSSGAGLKKGDVLIFVLTRLPITGSNDSGIAGTLGTDAVFTVSDTVPSNLSVGDTFFGVVSTDVITGDITLEGSLVNNNPNATTANDVKTLSLIDAGQGTPAGFIVYKSSSSHFGYYGSDYFSGCIDDFRLYNKNLTPDEVKHLYNRQLSGGNLALHLPLTENTNNNLKDKSIYKHVTTNHGVESGDIGPVGGSIKFNPFGVLNFDGVDDYVSIANPSTDLSGNLTISMWFLSSVSSWADTLISKDYDSEFDINYTTAVGGFRFHQGASNNSNFYYYDTSYSISPNIWYHLVYTREGSGTNWTIKLYINGVLIDTPSVNTTNGGGVANTPPQTTSNILIGAQNNDGNAGATWQGQISDVRIYDSALTAEQVKDIYFNQTILGTEVAHYKFNEKMGTTAFDSSGNGYDGTLTGGPTYYLSNPYRNYAMDFDGTDDYILISEKFQTPKFTVSFWANAVDDGDSSSSHSTISNRYHDSVTAHGWNFYTPIGNTGYWQFWIGIGTSATWSTISTSSAVSYNEWHHVVGTYDGTKLKFYIDNVLIGSITSTYGYSSAGNHANGTEIGRNDNGNSYNYKGSISDVRIYDYSLDAEEIYKVYKTGEVFGTEKIHYTFNQGGGDKVLDQSGNGHHGTANNGPTYQKIENPNLGSYLTVDSAERFNHSNSYLYPMYDISSKSHSFFCWMKLDENYTSGKNDNCIFSKVLNKNYVDMALSLNNGKLEFETKFNDNIDSSIIETYPTFLTNQWYHIGYSIDFTESSNSSISNKKNGLFKYYINGIMHTKYKLKYNLNLPYDNNIECAQKESIINVIDSGGNKYVFNNSSTYNSSKIIGFYLGKYVFKNISSEHPMAILNINSPGITYRVVDDSPIVIKVSGGNTSATNGDYYSFTDSDGNSIDIGNGTFRFMRGRSYQFQANGISGSHPFIIHISGSNTSSISGTGSNLDITIPVDHSTTSGDLYYQCTSHSSMKANLSLLYQSVSGTTSDGSYDFFYGDIDVTVNSNFNTASIYCYYHGYMGGENLLKYSIYCSDIKNNNLSTHNIKNYHSSKLYIGKRGDSSLSTFNDSTFKGCLSDVRFYNTEITPMQVRELFFNRNDGTILNTENSGTKSNQILFEKNDGTDILISHWPLSNNNSKIIFDKSRDTTHNNNNGTLISNYVTGDVTLNGSLTNANLSATTENHVKKISVLSAAGSGGTSPQFVVYKSNSQYTASKKTEAQTAVNTGTPSANQISFGATSNILEQHDNSFIDVLESSSGAGLKSGDVLSFVITVLPVSGYSDSGIAGTKGTDAAFTVSDTIPTNLSVGDIFNGVVSTDVITGDITLQGSLTNANPNATTANDVKTLSFIDAAGSGGTSAQFVVYKSSSLFSPLKKTNIQTSIDTMSTNEISFGTRSNILEQHDASFIDILESNPGDGLKSGDVLSFILTRLPIIGNSDSGIAGTKGDDNAFTISDTVPSSLAIGDIFNGVISTDVTTGDVILEGPLTNVNNNATTANDVKTLSLIDAGQGTAAQFTIHKSNSQFSAFKRTVAQTAVNTGTSSANKITFGFTSNILEQHDASFIDVLEPTSGDGLRIGDVLTFVLVVIPTSSNNDSGIAGKLGNGDTFTKSDPVPSNLSVGDIFNGILDGDASTGNISLKGPLVNANINATSENDVQSLSLIDAGQGTAAQFIVYKSDSQFSSFKKTSSQTAINTISTNQISFGSRSNILEQHDASFIDILESSSSSGLKSGEILSFVLTGLPVSSNSDSGIAGTKGTDDAFTVSSTIPNKLALGDIFNGVVSTNNNRFDGITGSIPLFNGINNQMKINCSTAISGIKSISFWIKPESVSQKTLLYLKDDSNDTFIEINNNSQISTSNIISPSIYVNTINKKTEIQTAISSGSPSTNQISFSTKTTTAQTAIDTGTPSANQISFGATSNVLEQNDASFIDVLEESSSSGLKSGDILTFKITVLPVSGNSDSGIKGTLGTDKAFDVSDTIPSNLSIGDTFTGVVLTDVTTGDITLEGPLVNTNTNATTANDVKTLTKIDAAGSGGTSVQFTVSINNVLKQNDNSFIDKLESSIGDGLKTGDKLYFILTTVPSIGSSSSGISGTLGTNAEFTISDSVPSNLSIGDIFKGIVSTDVTTGNIILQNSLVNTNPNATTANDIKTLSLINAAGSGGTSAQFIIYKTPTLEIEKWYHIVINTSTSITTDTSIYVASKTSTDYYNGLIDDIRFYNLELTTQQINNLYYQQSNSNLPNNNELIGKWLLDGNFNDSSFNSNNGELNSRTLNNNKFTLGYKNKLAFESNANNSSIAIKNIYTDIKTISLWLKPSNFNNFYKKTDIQTAVNTGTMSTNQISFGTVSGSVIEQHYSSLIKKLQHHTYDGLEPNSVLILEIVRLPISGNSDSGIEGILGTDAAFTVSDTVPSNLSIGDTFIGTLIQHKTSGDIPIKFGKLFNTNKNATTANDVKAFTKIKAAGSGGTSAQFIVYNPTIHYSGFKKNIFMNLGYDVSLTTTNTIDLGSASSPSLYINGVKDNISGTSGEHCLNLNEWNHICFSSNSTLSNNTNKNAYKLLPIESIPYWSLIPPSYSSVQTWNLLTLDNTDYSDHIFTIVTSDESAHNFNFYGSNYSKIYVNTNGFISLEVTNASFVPTDIFNKKIINVFATNLRPYYYSLNYYTTSYGSVTTTGSNSGGRGDIYYGFANDTNGNKNSILVILYKDVQHADQNSYNTTYFKGTNNIEVKLYLNNANPDNVGKIEISYGINHNVSNYTSTSIVNDIIGGISNGVGETNFIFENYISNTGTRYIPSNCSYFFDYNYNITKLLEGKKVTFIPTNSLFIGDNTFSGAIQNVEFYNTQLTDTQVKDIYKYGTYNDLVLHYKFDEGSGNTALDNSRNNYDGTIVSATYTSNYLEEENKALIFNGTNNYLINSDIVKSGDTNFFGNTKFSISLWFKANNTLDGTPNNEVILNLGGNIILNWDNSDSNFRGAWRVQQSSTWKYAKYTGSPTNNTWYHAVATFDSSVGLKAYLNGAHNVDASSSNATIDTPTSNLLIGARTISADYFDGSVADVRIYNYVLTANQITDLYYQNKSHNVNNLGYDNQYLTFSQKDIKNNSIINDETHIQRDNLKLYYKFKDSGNQYVKDYGNTLKPISQSHTYATGVFKSGSTETNISISILTNGKDGIPNTSLKLDGIDDNITISNSILFNHTYPGGTISLWIQANYINENILQLSAHDGSGNSDDVYLQLTTDFKLKMTFDLTTTNIYLYINGKVDGYLASGKILTSNNSIDPLIWNHIGVSFYDYDLGGTLTADQIKLGLIGDTIDTTTVFDGAFDEFKIFDKQLSSEQIYQLYLDRKSAPLIHLPMQETSGSKLCNIGTSKIDVTKLPNFLKQVKETLFLGRYILQNFDYGGYPPLLGNTFDFNDKYIVACFSLSSDILLSTGEFQGSAAGGDPSAIGVVTFIKNSDNTYGINSRHNQYIGNPSSDISDSHFGVSLSLNNNTFATSEPTDGITGESNTNDGLVFIYTINNDNNFVLTKTITNPFNDYYFGTSVHLDTNILVVGTPKHNSSIGIVHIYDRNDDYSLITTLTTTTQIGNSRFGAKVCSHNNQIFVSAPGEDQTAGATSDYTGCVYIFQKSGNNWYESQRLVASDGAAGYYFGYYFTVSNNVMLISSRNTTAKVGKVYIFTLNPSTKLWTQDTTNILTETNSASHFEEYGVSTGYYNNNIFVSAFKYGSSKKGRVFHYYYNPDTNTKRFIAFKDGFQNQDRFGSHLKVRDNKLIVGGNSMFNNGALVVMEDKSNILNLNNIINPSFNKNCLNFDGIGDIYQINTDINTIHSISLWIKPTEIGNRILYYVNSNVKLEINSNNQINAYGFTSPSIYINNKLETVSNSGSNNNSETNIITNNWYHIVVVSNTSVSSVINSSYIGHDNSNTTTTLFQGQMSDFRIYDFQLSKSEIHKLYNYSNIYKSIAY